MSTIESSPTKGQALPGRRSRQRSDLGVALLFVGPAAIGFLTFYLWPTLRGTYLSFTDSKLLGTPNFIGLENYRTLIQDPLFWNSLRVILLYVAINIGLQTVLALALAVLMHRLTQSTLIRGVVLMPWLIANVIVALLWMWMLDYQLGIVNNVLDWVALDRVAFLGNVNWAMPTIALINVWRHLGYTALLIFAGLQMIPKTLYEAAALDGSSEWHTFWRITMPMLRPVLVLVLVLTVVGSFQVFDTIAVTTAGGPVNSTRAIYFYIFEQAFQRFNFGYASAMSVVLFLILAGIALAQLKLMRGDESELS